VTVPGKVNNISASVVFNDNNLSPEKKEAIRSIVMGAIGYKEERGDMIQVVGMEFNTDLQDQVAEDLDGEETDESLLSEFSKYRIYVYAGAAGLLLLLILIVIIRKRSKKKKAEMETENIDITVNDDYIGEELEVEEDFEKMTPAEEEGIEKRIKHFANEYPDNMAELIKAWLAEDER